MANFNLDTTYEVACSKLAQKSPMEMATNSGTEYDEEKSLFKVMYMNEQYQVSYPDGKVNFVEKEDEIDLKTQCLILHYLTTANGAPIKGEYISFKELPDGAIYIEPFTKRAINPMLKIFENDLEAFKELGKKLGGKEEKMGDVSMTFHVFSKVPITYVIWAADDEFPASGNILFDASASNYLPTEDYALGASLVIYRLGDMMRNG